MSQNRIELQIKKDHSFRKLKKVELIFFDHQTGLAHAINLDKETLLMMEASIPVTSSYMHDDFYIEKDGEYQGDIILKVTHRQAAYRGYEHLVAYVAQSSFLELTNGLYGELAYA